MRQKPRPGRPIPFHEPEPDRLAKAELIRQTHARKEAERLARAEQNETARMSTGLLPVARERYGRATVNRTPPVDNPDTRFCCAPEEAAIRGERNGVVLYFASTRMAEYAMAGLEVGKKRFRISGSLSESRIYDRSGWEPYGWKWTRLRDTRGDNKRNATGKL
jgi:hypothetical protein